MHFVRAALIWIVIIVVETIHGALRTLLLQPLVGDLRARQIGVVVGSLLILLIVYLFNSWLSLTSRRALLEIGLLWVVLTAAFEVGLGRLVLNLSWERILSDYNLSQGGLMAFGLIFLALAPLIVSRLHAIASRHFGNRAG